MALLTLQDAELAFGLHPLLDSAQLVVQDGERTGLLGRKGPGKSVLTVCPRAEPQTGSGDGQRRARRARERVRAGRGVCRSAGGGALGGAVGAAWAGAGTGMPMCLRTSVSRGIAAGSPATKPQR